MNKKMDIHCDGKRQYQFVADTAYIREAGTDGEKAAAKYISQELGEDSRIEFFEFSDFQEKEQEVTHFLKKETAGDWKSAVFLLYWKTVTTRWSQQDGHN